MKFLVLLLFIVLQTTAYSQDKLVKDLDNDGIKDTVYFDTERSVIICQLSTQQFRKIESKPLENMGDASGVKDAKGGFYFNENWMRAGYSNQFRYDVKTKKIQLIGMSRYEFGNAANDGSGESSVNLLTGKYVGNWNYFDQEKVKLIAIPEIKTKMDFGKIYLEDFSDATYFKFAEKCSDLYNEKKKEMIKK
ncbi:hypothetical protein AMR72_04125 [Flavobacterium psychrophilum]|nr:hypothetical protein AMR72_04125 [Flavobacterium psychrophilum]AOE51771.1 hypothetical protein ALW18_04120 [Flavobacterium psychrophilum]